MMDLNNLEDLLKLLRHFNVASFKSSEYQIELNPAGSEPIIVNEAPAPPIPRQVVPKSMFHEKSLWPNGKPPEFPK